MLPLRSHSQHLQLILGLGLVLGMAFFMSGCRSYPNCRTDAHCQNYNQGTPYCVDRICRACSQDGHCGRGQRCENFTCVRIAGYCEDDSQCPHPQRCRDNRCGAQCLSDSECGAGQHCEAGRCVETPECRGDGDCADGMICRGGRCVAPPEPPRPCADGQMRTINFDFDQFTLRSDAIAALEYNMACLRENPNRRILIEGHCDERGTHEYNMRLGERRAQAARNWMVNAGLDRSRIRTVSYGFTRPLDNRSNEAAWSRNRRAEFRFE